MKQKLTLLCCFALTTLVSFSQKKEKHTCEERSMLGMHINTLDFSTINAWRSNKAPKTLSGFKKQDLGFSLSYWKMVYKNVDFSGKATLLFHDYAGIDRKTYSTNINQFAFILEPTVNAYLFEAENKYNAFVTAGLGFGTFSNKFGAYFPGGIGLLANFQHDTKVMIQTQYQATLSKKVLNDNLAYSIGLVQNIGKEKPKVVVPPPPPPVVDRDNDGVLDVTDKCPDVAGIEKYQGCPIPDTDGDGLNDEKDKCPSVAGNAKYEGCPVPDTDGDGINDDNDKCATVKGLARYQGCPIPDTDGDGVNDEDDKCPSVAGLASNMGCPEIEKAVIEKVNFAAKSIQYALGSAKILPASFKSLNELVTILNGDNSLKIDIEGHSDNVGSEERNKTLSQERAESVKKYLMDKGIDASRINAQGFGSEKPIADNKTAAGRASNRRTEMKVRNF
jgi:OOP family OmpA-OmpF porin